MAFLFKQFDAHMTCHATLLSYFRAAIGDQYRIATQKAKSLKKSPRDNEDSLSYLARLVEIMITGGANEGQYAAARLEEAHANEVAIAQELPVISEEHTPSYSIALKEVARVEAKELMVVDDDPGLVKPMDKYIGKMFLDAGEDRPCVVHVVQYDEREAGSTTRRRACGLNRERVGRRRCRLYRLSRAAMC
jgi:hypothetical protein